MSPQRPEEAYSEEEFRRILEVAAREGAAPEAEGGAGAGEGYTLSEMVEIAWEAGIDPAAVTRAASDVRRSRAEPRGGTGVLGGLFPRLVHREAELSRRLTDSDQAPDLVVGATATGFLGLLLMAVAEGAFGGGGLVTVVLVTAGIYGVLRWQASWLTRRTLRRLDDWLDRVRAAVD